MHIARFVFICAVALTGAIQAQSVISAKSGTIHYVEGKVLLNDQEISPKFGEFPAMDNGAVLRTTDQGRVEVLLTPGVILRVGEGSSIRMAANSLTDTRVELQAGRAVLECSEILKGDAITLLVAGKSISFAKNGLYEATVEPALLRVYKGEATVLENGRPVLVKRGHEALLGSEMVARKFDDNATDDLYNWSSRRSGYLALANISAASSMSGGYGGYGGYGNGYGGFGYGFAGGGWAWNPWFGMFTMVPSDGMLWSPFGYGFYSPFSVYDAYVPYTYGGGGGGGGRSTASGHTTSGGRNLYGGRPVTMESSSGSGGSGRSGASWTPASAGRSGGLSSGMSSGGGGRSGGGGGHGH